MSEEIAVEEREFSMPRLLSAIFQDIAFYFKSFRLKFTRRLVFADIRLQTRGSQGEDITLFQERFNLFANRHGIFAPVSGVYDSATIDAVADFQREVMYVLEGDGFVGPETARVLHIKLLEI